MRLDQAVDRVSVLMNTGRFTTREAPELRKAILMVCKNFLKPLADLMTHRNIKRCQRKYHSRCKIH